MRQKATTNEWKRVPGHSRMQDGSESHNLLALRLGKRIWVVRCLEESGIPLPVPLGAEGQLSELASLVFAVQCHWIRASWRLTTTRLQKKWCRLIAVALPQSHRKTKTS